MIDENLPYEKMSRNHLYTLVHRWRMPYGRCGRCHTNFARATPTFCPFIIIGHTNFDLLVNHILFWPHQLWKPSSAHALVLPYAEIKESRVLCEGDIGNVITCQNSESQFHYWSYLHFKRKMRPNSDLKCQSYFKNRYIF